MHDGAGALTEPERRHQVLEQGAGPRQKHAGAMCNHVRATQMQPALLRDVALGDSDKTGNASFGGQQVIGRPVVLSHGHVEADRQHFAAGVVQEREVHFRNKRLRGGGNLHQPRA